MRHFPAIAAGFLFFAPSIVHAACMPVSYVNPVSAQVATVGGAYDFTVPADTFDPAFPAITYEADQGTGDPITYGEPLPAWLSFEAAEGRFHGTPASGDVGAYNLRLTAFSGACNGEGLFTLTVSEQQSGGGSSGITTSATKFIIRKFFGDVAGNSPPGESSSSGDGTFFEVTTIGVYDAINVDAAGASPGTLVEGDAIIFTITNNGAESSGMLSVSILGNDNHNFEIFFNDCAGNILAPGDVCDIRIFSQANENGSYSASLSVSGTPGGTLTQGISGSASGFVSNENGGGLYCWGNNSWSEGALGDGTTNDSLEPVEVVGMGYGVTSVDAGGYHTCGIQNGALKCWGANWYGQLGDQASYEYNSTVPVDVYGMGSGVSKVSAGDWHSCAIQNGSLKCWGWNSSGQLGDGTTTESAIPVNVVGMESDVTSVAAGGYNSNDDSYTCAIQSGALKCWGNNEYGQLGVGDEVARLEPTPVIGMESGVTAVDVSREYGAQSCAIQNGGVKCWGANSEGYLGDGTYNDSNIPVSVVGMESGVTALAVAPYHACAIQNGALKCWGGHWGVLLGNGDDGMSDSPVPVDVVGMGGGVTAVSAGDYHTCAIQDNELKCWGYNWEGELGDGTYNDSNIPVNVIGVGSNIIAVAAGGYHTCGNDWQDPTLVISAQIGNPLHMDITDGISPGLPVSFTITNTGDVATGSITVTLPELNFEKVADTCHSQMLAPATSCSITIRPVATEKGSYSGALQLSANPGGKIGRTISGTASGFPDPCISNPSPGTLCDDGMVYVGLSPDGGMPMYVARCNYGYVYVPGANQKTSAACSPVLSCTSYPFIKWGTGYVLTGIQDWNTGAENTAALAALGANYDAAAYCQNLGDHGHDDWFLPAMNELAVIGQAYNMAPSGDWFQSSFSSGQYYWSSTERDSYYAWFFNFTAETQIPASKDSEYTCVQVRCARKYSGGLGMGVQQGEPDAMHIVAANSPGEDVVFSITNGDSVASGQLIVNLTGDTGNFERTADSCYNQILQPSENCSITIRPTATNNGNYSGAISVSATPGGTVSYALSGTASGFVLLCENPLVPPPCITANGAVYVGSTPDGNVPLYVARCDYGFTHDPNADQTDNALACLGSRGIRTWGAYGTTTGITNAVSGEMNTTVLASTYGDTAAAIYCYNLDAHGYSDWYLPAKNELSVLQNTANNTDGWFKESLDFSGSWPFGYYWTSSENNNTGAWLVKLDYLSAFVGYNKNVGFSVRCVRK